MKVGDMFYQNGEAFGRVIHCGRFSVRDSRNPHFSGQDKSNQFSVIVEPTGSAESINFETGSWEVASGAEKIALRIMDYYYAASRAFLSVEIVD